MGQDCRMLSPDALSGSATGSANGHPAERKPPVVLPVSRQTALLRTSPFHKACRPAASVTKDKTMFNKHSVEIEWAGRPLKLETGQIARQADGAVLATYGETVVLATVVSAKSPKPGQDFFPLTVNYQEKTYA